MIEKAPGAHVKAGYEAVSDEAWKYWVKNGLYTELKGHLKNEEDIDQFLEKVQSLLPENARESIDDIKQLVQKVDNNTKKDDRILAKARVVADNFPPQIDTLEKMFPQVDVLQFRRMSRSSTPTAIPTASNTLSEPAAPRNVPEPFPKVATEHMSSLSGPPESLRAASVRAEVLPILNITRSQDGIAHSAISAKAPVISASGFLGRIGYFGAAIGAVVAAPFVLMGGFLVGYFYVLNKAYDKFLKPFFEGKKKEGHAKKKQKKHDDHHGSGHGHGGGDHAHH